MSFSTCKHQTDSHSRPTQGWTKPSAFGDLNALNEDEWDKCWAVNCKANMHLLRAALPTFNQNEEGGVMLMTSSVAVGCHSPCLLLRLPLLVFLVLFLFYFFHFFFSRQMEHATEMSRIEYSCLPTLTSHLPTYLLTRHLWHRVYTGRQRLWKYNGLLSD